MNTGHASVCAARRRTGWLLAVGGAVAFSGKAIIVKLAYRYGVDAVTLIMYRMLFALPLFLAMLWWATHRAREPVAPLTWRDRLGIVWLGFTGYYAASFLDFWGLQYISASLERLILYLNPTLVLLLGWLLYGRAVTARQAGAMALSYAGVLLVFGHEVRFDGWNTAIGAGLVLASAVSYAIYLVYSGQMVRRLGSLRLVGWATTVACLLCLLQFVLLRPLAAAVVAPEVIALSVVNAVLCTAAPVVMVMMAIERIGSAMTAQAGMVGPLSTIALGVVVLGEPLNAWIVAGTALVLGGVLWVSRSPA
ncbi:DMT family transporter [Tepidimonas taiwanensis]|uniref:2A78: carboxylate/amino acid/amine transporter n=1 Tax=Tepidimonas taiwanensis TaxID=307486 RepID=A0A554X0S6_9BURK|nr:DMT family transporter [Tepidimonas taiwanensis]TSE29395.1 2A78: carboxylate/amino acid/amine transporter [Tepidimonas taiwanensis]UBQ04752.1 DMT family transporter [Tepidimonas taiwanensis]